MSGLVALFLMIVADISSYLAGPVLPNYNADLSAIRWDHGVPLIMLYNPGTPADEVGWYVFSGDGKISRTFGTNMVSEFLSPQKLLVGDTSLYMITPERVQLIEQSAGQDYQHLSLSPQQDFLAYDLGDSRTHCISTFDFETLGPCVDIMALLPPQWDWATEAYFDIQTDSNWDKTSDQYVIRVRSRLVYDLVPSHPTGMPPRQEQRELARFSYDPVTQTVQALPLTESIILKTPDIFLTPAEQPLLNYFRRGADITITRNHFDQSIGIEQHSTNLRAKLADVTFFRDVPAFDVVTYKK